MNAIEIVASNPIHLVDLAAASFGALLLLFPALVFVFRQHKAGAQAIAIGGALALLAVIVTKLLFVSIAGGAALVGANAFLVTLPGGFFGVWITSRLATRHATNDSPTSAHSHTDTAAVRVGVTHNLPRETVVASAGSASTHERQISRLSKSRMASASSALLVTPTEEHWSLALTEVEGPSRRSGLWAKCFADAAGNEATAKAAYLAERAAQLLTVEQEERQRRERVSAAERQLEAYRASLSEVSSEIFVHLDHIELNSHAAVGSFVKLIRLLGGKVDWKADLLSSPRWRVSFEGKAHEFRSDEDLSGWALAEVVPFARAVLPPMNDPDKSIGRCPSCNVVVRMDAKVCLKCNAAFSQAGSWQPFRVDA